MQTCQECGRQITVFVGEPTGLDWAFRPFCDSCRSRIRSGAACPECTTTFADFLERGTLGCETCYTVHSRRLLPLLRSTRFPGTGPSAFSTPGQTAAAPDISSLDRLARVRTDEARSLVLEDDPGVELEAANIPGVEFKDGVYRSPPVQPPESSARPSPVVRSVRLRVARNLVGLPYLSSEERTRRLAAVMLSPGSILSRRRAAAGESDPAAAVGFLVGDEDHLRFEWIFPFADESSLARRMAALAAESRELDRLYCWQKHRDFGMLAACPANSGSGIRLSFRVAVPGLLAGGRWEPWRRELENAGLEIRGPAGEGSRAIRGKGVLQISNRFWPAGIDLSQETLRIFAILRRLAAQEQGLL